MNRNFQRAIAKAIRSAGSQSGMSFDQISKVADEVGAAIEENMPKNTTFDREVFDALATQPE